MKSKTFILFLCLIISQTFIFSKELNLEFINKVAISEDIGLIKEVYIPEKKSVKELVAYIQDAHCHYEAQMNIGKIVKVLVEDYHFSLVNVEGTEGIIDTRPFSAFSERKVKLDFADYFMKNGKLTGPEYLSITTDLEFSIFGIEDEDLYAENYTAYMKTLDIKDKVLAYASKLLERLNDLKKHIYSEKLYLFDLESVKYDKKEIEFSDFTLYLENFVNDNEIDIDQFKNFDHQSKARKIEDQIDFKNIEEQRSLLIEKFQKILADNKGELKIIIQKSLGLRLKEISPVEYYSYLTQKAKEYKIEPKEYEMIQQYSNYLNYYHLIDKTKILDETAELTIYVRNQLYENDTQKKLGHLSRIMTILNKLFQLEVIPYDYNYFLKNKSEFNFRDTSDFILKHGKQYKIYIGFEVDHDVIEKNLKHVIDFYKLAKERDIVLYQNAMNRLRTTNQDRCVLITGGFHTEGVTKKLKNDGIAYILIAPKITDPNAETPYEEVMRAQADSVKGYNP